MEKWLVTINEQDGMGGGKDVDYWFEEWEDACRFYNRINDLKGTPFHPSTHKPPTLKPFPIPKIYRKGEKTGWEKNRD